VVQEIPISRFSHPCRDSILPLSKWDEMKTILAGVIGRFVLPHWFNNVATRGRIDTVAEG